MEEGFLRVRCEGCHAEKLVAFSCKKRGFCPSCGGRRMAETAALLSNEVLPERPVPAPTGAELQAPVQQIAARIGKVLEQRGLIERDLESVRLAMQGEGGPLDDLIGHSITYRVAVGPRAGQKLFTLQTVPAREPESEQQGDGRGAANASGFSLHAGLDIPPHQREKLERCVPLREPPADSGGTLGQARFATRSRPRTAMATHIVLRTVWI